MINANYYCLRYFAFFADFASFVFLLRKLNQIASFYTMKAAPLLIIILFLFSIPALAQSKTRPAGVSSSAAAVNPFDEVDRLMTYGENLESDKKSLLLAEHALQRDGGNYQWLWRVARACYYVGDNVAGGDKIRLFERGMAAGQRAIVQLPNAAEGHFWLAVNYGGYADQKGVFRALQLVKKIRSEMETVLRLNDRYHDGGAYLALGEMDRQLPRIIGGNVIRAITRLEQGLRIAPDNLEMRLGLARAYYDAGRNEDARRQLQDILGRQINPSRARAERDIQEKARKLLSKL
jgi:tetratricopeptide (TPR) repeat protein